MQKLKLSKPARILLAAILIAAGLVIGEVLPGNAARIWLMVAAAVIAGTPIFLKAFSALRYKIVGIDALVTVAVAGALAIGEVWEAAAVTFLFSFGDYLEARSLEKTRSSIKALLEMAPATARVLRDGVEVEVDSASVRSGDLVIAKPGERLAVDGEVVEGYGSLNQAAITGEPLPVEASAGQSVFSGSILEAGYLVVRATRVGEETSFARILHLVEEAQDRKARTQKFLERFSRYYTPAVMVLAVLLYLVTMDIHLALTLLVIACPGALVISTPVSIVAGIGAGARQGILVKGGETLETLGSIRAIAFDKTGTLTEGKPRVLEFKVFGGARPSDVVEIAAAGEAYSEHPLGAAILDFAQNEFGVANPQRPSETSIVPGQGIEFTLQGTSYLLGNRKLLAGHGIKIPADVEAALADQEQLGRTAVILGTAEKVLGIISIADTLRQDAATAGPRLRKLGIAHLAMLTGDNGRTATVTARKLGLDAVHHDLLPEDKVNALAAIRAAHGATAMIGDGVNDAPALAAADLGIAMGGGASDVAMETADVVLLSSKLERLADAIALSRATLRNMKQNIVFSLFVAAFLLAGVLVKTVNLSLGMLVHEVSVLLVILNALRLRTFGLRKPESSGSEVGAAKAA